MTADFRAGKQMHRMVVKPETALIRPFVVAAILRGVRLDATRFASFIDLQDKLHQNLCRQRSLVAIGTHDLSTLQVLSVSIATTLQGGFQCAAFMSYSASFAGFLCLDPEAYHPCPVCRVPSRMKPCRLSRSYLRPSKRSKLSTQKSLCRCAT